MKNTCSIILLLLVFNFQLSAQNQLQHYERKVSFSRITLPGDQFHSKNFLIVYADSIYNSATIHVKKASFPTVKNIDVQLKTENKTYNFVQLSTKSKKKYALIKDLLAKQLECSREQLEEKNYETNSLLVSFKEQGRTKIITITRALI